MGFVEKVDIGVCDTAVHEHDSACVHGCPLLPVGQLQNMGAIMHTKFLTNFKVKLLSCSMHETTVSGMIYNARGTRGHQVQ